MTKELKLNDGLISALRGADRLWAEKEAQLASGELACRPGCFGCCVGLFAISLPEALLLRSAVAGLPDSTRSRIHTRAERAVARSAAAFPGDPSAGVLDPDRTEAADTAFFETVRATACPVLELPSGRCLAYSARPTTCRTYGLALAQDSGIVLPACELNLASATPERVLQTAIDARRLMRVDHEVARTAADAGLPAGAETTIAHALTGTAFAALAGGAA